MKKYAEEAIAWWQEKPVEWFGDDGKWHRWIGHYPPPVNDNHEWRIAPEPKPDEVLYIGFDWKQGIAGVLIGKGLTSWPSHIKLTKSGETGEITAEVVK